MRKPSEESNLLWVAATGRELSSVPAWIPGRRLVTGCGPAAAGAALGWELGRNGVPDLVVGVGVCGVYPDAGPEPRDVVVVESDGFCDLGADSPDGLIELWNLGFPGHGVESVYPMAVPDFLGSLPRVAGTTCSVCTGSLAAAVDRRRRTGAAVESMEGAAWALACRMAGAAFAQVRAVSNVAGPRDRGAWKLSEALAALEGALEESCRVS